MNDYSDFQKVYILGRFSGDTREFAGVFTAKSKALNQVDGQGYFVAPAYIDMPRTAEAVDWPDLEMVAYI